MCVVVFVVCWFSKKTLGLLGGFVSLVVLSFCLVFLIVLNVTSESRADVRL